MAVVERKVTIVGNPGRRYFGGLASRKASARALKSRQSARVSNPGGSILGYTLGNPGRKARMAKAKKRKSSKPRGYKKHHSNPARRRTYKSHRRRSQPRMVGNPVYRRKRIHHNPGFASGIGDFTMNAIFVLVGGLGSKLGTQAVLGSNNVGLIGYAGNAAAGGVLWFITRMLPLGPGTKKNAEAGIISGTILQILLRVINDYTPFGSYVNQLGMGDYQMQSFVTPQVLVDPWNNAQIQIPPGWGAPQLAAPQPTASTGSGRAMAAATGTSGLYGRGGGWGGGLYS